MTNGPTTTRSASVGSSAPSVNQMSGNRGEASVESGRGGGNRPLAQEFALNQQKAQVDPNMVMGKLYK